MASLESQNRKRPFSDISNSTEAASPKLGNSLAEPSEKAAPMLASWELLKQELLDCVTDATWREFCLQQAERKYFRDLMKKLADLYDKKKTIYPPKQHILRALGSPKFENIRVVLLGQDPYHNAGEACGFSFAVPDGIRVPPSLRNMYKSIYDDPKKPSSALPQSGRLDHWVDQGVLLLNAVLTVDGDAKARSHAALGWTEFTGNALEFLHSRRPEVVFLLMGRDAQKMKPKRKTVKCVECAHPSPLSQRHFFESRPFEDVNKLLVDGSLQAIDWLPK